jgi:hypothetical protein
LLSRGHSAHVGQEVEVYYRWHPLFGRRVRREYTKRRASGDVVYVETEPGVVVVLAAWMLDPVACAGMESGEPRVCVAALVELHRLLSDTGFRGNSPGDSYIVQEKQNGHPAQTAQSGPDALVAADGSPPTPHRVRLLVAPRDERKRLAETVQAA